MKYSDIIKTHHYRILNKYVIHALKITQGYNQSINEENNINKKISLTKKFNHWKRRYYLYLFFLNNYINKMKNKK